MIWIALLSFALTLLILVWMLPRLKAAGMTGKDVNKPGKPDVPEMGGLAVLLALIITISFVLALDSFSIIRIGDNVPIMAVTLSLVFVGLIGIIDDFLDMPQLVKALAPIIGALPLVALKVAGATYVMVPYFGSLDFGIFYFLAVIPLSMTVSANLTNMLAGFNGLEFGMALPTYFFAMLLGVALGKTIIVVFAAAMLGASVAFLLFNFRGKAFPGDVGNLMIGALLAAILIAGNLESFGAVFAIYVLEFIIKALNGFPSHGWAGEYKDGKLHASKAISLPQLVMKMTGGISERNLVLLFSFAQFLLCLAVSASILFHAPI